MLRGKKYSKITDDQRRDFIDAVENNGEKIIHVLSFYFFFHDVTVIGGEEI